MEKRKKKGTWEIKKDNYDVNTFGSFSNWASVGFYIESKLYIQAVNSVHTPPADSVINSERLFEYIILEEGGIPQHYHIQGKTFA